MPESNPYLFAAARRSYCDNCLQDTLTGCCLCGFCPACCQSLCEDMSDPNHGACHLPDTDEAHWDWRRAGPTRALRANAEAAHA